MEAVELALEQFLGEDDDSEDLAKALGEAIGQADAGQTIALDEFDRDMRVRYGIPG